MFMIGIIGSISITHNKETKLRHKCGKIANQSPVQSSKNRKKERILPMYIIQQIDIIKHHAL